MIEWLKRLIAPREMAALRRYRLACHEAHRWNGQIPGSAETALWIQACGEDLSRPGIERFRESLSSAEMALWIQACGEDLSRPGTERFRESPIKNVLRQRSAIDCDASRPRDA